MEGKKLHDFLFEMYDYADFIADKIQPDNSYHNDHYFLTLIYIEDIMDSYGRGEINDSARDAGLDPSAALKEAHRRIDLLRVRIRSLSKEYNFDSSLEKATSSMYRDWRRRTV